MPICPTCSETNLRLGAKCESCPDSFFVDENAVERASRDPYIGTQVDDKYSVVGRISEGGMGAVYRAVHMPVERQVAFKVLRAELEDESEVRDRFRREARAISKLNHPNIVTLFDFGFDESDCPYMVMEYLRGTGLAQWMRRSDLELAAILAVVRQMLSALAYAHERDVVHRDLKPENMVLCSRPDGEQLKLLDFGIARMLDRRTEQRLTREGEVYGTPQYMAPEQAVGRTDIGPAADVYAVGILLYEMLSGEVPFDGTEPLAVALQHRDEPMPKLVAREGLTAPEELRKLVETATAKDPNDRYVTGGEMLEVFESYYGSDRSGSPQTAGGESERVTAPADGGASQTKPTVERETFREVDSEQIGGGSEEEQDESLGLDWGGFEEHASADKDRAGQRQGVYDSIMGKLGGYLFAAGAVLGAIVFPLAALVVLGARFDELAWFYRFVVGISPWLLAGLSAGVLAKTKRSRRFVRDANLFGALGFVAAHIPDPVATAQALLDEPVWFLGVFADAAALEAVTSPCRAIVGEYASLVLVLFGG